MENKKLSPPKSLRFGDSETAMIAKAIGAVA
jgi:hypothetical protein